MKTTLLTLVLLSLTGSGAPQAVTQAAASLQQTSKAKPQRVTPDQPASEFTGKVIKVVDGDTIDVLTDDMETIRIRFSGIDTPERGQPFGNNVPRRLKELVAGEISVSFRTVMIDTIEQTTDQQTDIAATNLSQVVVSKLLCTSSGLVHNSFNDHFSGRLFNVPTKAFAEHKFMSGPCLVTRKTGLSGPLQFA